MHIAYMIYFTSEKESQPVEYMT